MERYAVDLDGTVFNIIESFLLYCKIKHNIVFSHNDLCYFNFVDRKFGKNNGMKLFDNFSKHNRYINPPVIQYAVEVLKQLSLIGDIYIITARPKEYRKETAESLINLGINFRDIFIKTGINKMEIMDSLNITALIEDNGELCFNAANEGIRSYCIESNYNKKYIDKYKNIIGVKCWLDILANELKILNGGCHG